MCTKRSLNISTGNHKSHYKYITVIFSLHSPQGMQLTINSSTSKRKLKQRIIFHPQKRLRFKTERQKVAGAGPAAGWWGNACTYGGLSVCSQAGERWDCVSRALRRFKKEDAMVISGYLSFLHPVTVQGTH